MIVVSSFSSPRREQPADFPHHDINIKVGQVVNYKHFLYKLVEALYTRTERELEPATFRVNGDTVDIMAAFGEFGNQCFRVMFFDNGGGGHPVDRPRHGTAHRLSRRHHALRHEPVRDDQERINAAVQQIAPRPGQADRVLRARRASMEAQRIKQRVEYDLEMIKELGYCPGIENYSRYFDGRAAGTPPDRAHPKRTT